MPVLPNRRRQLTLLVAEPWRSRLNALRELLDPVQASLISAHVTLCREDELEGLSTASVLGRAGSWALGPLDLAFGPPQLFQGHGVLLPCIRGSGQFQRLRRWLLQDPGAREHAAHLTLAHPRNPHAAGHTAAALEACPRALELSFSTVTLIEQLGSAPWRALEERSLGLRAQGAV